MAPQSGQGVSGWRLAAVVVQLLDQAFLFEQLFLVGDLFLRSPVALAQGVALFGQGFERGFAAGDFGAAGLLLAGDFAAAAGQRQQLLPAADGGLHLPRLFAHLFAALAGEALLLLGLGLGQRGIGGRFLRVFRVYRNELLFGGLAVVGLLLRELAGVVCQRGQRLLQLAALLELLLPYGEFFTKAGALRLGGDEGGEFASFMVELIQCLAGVAGQRVGQPVGGFGVLQAGLGELLLAAALGGDLALAFGKCCLGLLPALVQRLQLDRGGAGGEAGELRGGVGGGLFGRGLPGLGVAQFAAGLIEVVAPLA